MPARRIGEQLVAEGKLSDTAVKRALGFQRLTGDRVRLGTILVNWNLLTEESLLDTLAKTHRCEAVAGDALLAAPVAVVNLLPAAAAIRQGALPYALDRGSARVAFHNPSNLAALDEVAAVIGKRVIPAVTTEVRLMQAHQRFYGRHLPYELRAAVQKLERKGGSPGPRQEAADFRARDLIQMERNEAGDSKPAAPTALPPNRRRAPLDRRSVSIPVSLGTPSETDPASAAAASPPPPFREALRAVPEEELGPARRPGMRLPPPPDFYTPEPTVPKRPALQQPPTPDAVVAKQPPPPAPPEDDSLKGWGWDVLGSLDGSFPSILSPLSSEQPEPASKREEEPLPDADTSPPPLSLEDAEGMWHTSHLDDQDDDMVSGMWTASSPETAPTTWEAKSRDEIAQAILENLLAPLPRVIVLTCGKTGILGWQGRGDRLTAGRVAAIWISARGRSVFAHVEKSGVPHFGTLDCELWPRAFADLLGPAPPACAVFPVRTPDGVAAFLYADRLGRPMLHEDFTMVARAAAWASSTLTQFLAPRDEAAPIN